MSHQHHSRVSSKSSWNESPWAGTCQETHWGAAKCIEETLSLHRSIFFVISQAWWDKGVSKCFKSKAASPSVSPISHFEGLVPFLFFPVFSLVDCVEGVEVGFRSRGTAGSSDVQNIKPNSHCVGHKIWCHIRYFLCWHPGSLSSFLYMVHALNQSTESFPKFHPLMQTFFCREGRGWIVASSQCGSGFKPAWVVAVCASAKL